METRLYTAEDLLDMEGDYELERGVLVEMTKPSFRHGCLCAEATYRLKAYARQVGGAVADNDPGCVLERGPDTLRGPDVAYICPERVAEIPEEGWLEGAPDLVVEVLSPGDRPGQVRKKVGEYLEAGCRLVWLFDRRHRTVEVYVPDAPVRVLRPGDVLDGGDVVPGFEWPVSEIFR